MSTIPTQSPVTTLLAQFTKMIIFLDGAVLKLTAVDSFNVMLAGTWAVNVGFVAANMDRWQGFL
jgi:hypothetical protein